MGLEVTIIDGEDGIETFSFGQMDERSVSEAGWDDRRSGA
jgi:hypothetical protein